MVEGTRSAPHSAAFLDRDGVINVDRGYVYRPDQLELTPTAAEGIRMLNKAGYLVLVVTNQSGVARGFFNCAEVEAFHAYMQTVLGEHDAHIDGFYYCPYHPDGVAEAFRRDHPDRKPGSGMVLRAIRDWSIDPEASFLIGDKPRDLAAACGAGIAAFPIEADTGDLARVVRDAIRYLHDRGR